MRKTAAFWTEDLLNKFIRVAMLTPEESEIIRLRIYSYTLEEIAAATGLSTSTVSRRIKLLNDKYDEVEVEYGFPHRTKLIKMDKDEYPS